MLVHTTISKYGIVFCKMEYATMREELNQLFYNLIFILF